jgi:hypothetical protein
MPMVDKDSRLNQDAEQLFWDLETERLFWNLGLDDDPAHDRCSPQHLYRNREHGYGANNSGQAAPPGVMCAGVRAMPATPATQVHKEAAQSAEAAEAAAPSQMGQDVPAARKGRLTMSRMSAGAAAAATEEEEKRADHLAQLAAMKMCLPFVTTQLRELWRYMRDARRPAPTEVHLTAAGKMMAVEKQLEKAEVLLRLT